MASRADRLLLLGLPSGSDPDDTLLRRHYLRAALRVHPDKDSSPGAAEQFVALKTAYESLVHEYWGTAWSAPDASERSSPAAADREAQLRAVLAAALAGRSSEDLEKELCELGVYRPPADFGIDLDVRFDARLPAGQSREDGTAAEEVAPAVHKMLQDAGIDPDTGDWINISDTSDDEEECRG
ncbi:hypothetical protein H632_c709p0 [Helicosporidium sp. ATCC 50920]|nr:hypothetical protein H632_c709p0 [Helicosporidium sp. ATCC 50920]|eukprot:KDD75384.1 hypothetical protein H632_c709p0 [Helicosporidium sp. ATCC 50920]